MIRNPRGRTVTTDIRPVSPGAPHPFDDSSREQGIMNRYIRSLDTNREQAIMNQYARPRGDVYTGGNPATDTMAALMGGMNRPQLEGITQLAYRPGSYGTDYDYDDYGPFIPESVFQMDEFGGEYDPEDDEYLFDLLRGNLTSIGQGLG